MSCKVSIKQINANSVQNWHVVVVVDDDDVAWPAFLQRMVPCHHPFDIFLLHDCVCVCVYVCMLSSTCRHNGLGIWKSPAVCEWVGVWESVTFSSSPNFFCRCHTHASILHRIRTGVPESRHTQSMWKKVYRGWNGMVVRVPWPFYSFAKTHTHTHTHKHRKFIM